MSENFGEWYIGCPAKIAGRCFILQLLEGDRFEVVEVVDDRFVRIDSGKPVLDELFIHSHCRITSPSFTREKQ
jgi:hypothetical protein